jgi:LPS export ABC transporter protein LptC
MKLDRIILFILTATLLPLACTETDKRPPRQESSSYPDSRLVDAEIVFTQEGKQSVNIYAKHIDRWEKNDSTEADTVEVIFYDKEGNRSSDLKANRGIIREKTEKVSLFGDVVAVNNDSTVLKTQSLFWNPETQLITTEDYVEITRRDGDILTGYGMKADRNLEEIQILKDVSGKVIELPETPEPEKPKPVETGDSIKQDTTINDTL